MRQFYPDVLQSMHRKCHFSNWLIICVEVELCGAQQVRSLTVVAGVSAGVSDNICTILVMKLGVRK
jgi:hypothetical protein